MENASVIQSSAVQLMKDNGLIIVVEYDSNGCHVFLVEEKNFDKEYNDIRDHVGYFSSIRHSETPETQIIDSTYIDHEWRNKGIGTIMYNTILALCTKQGFWLMSDRDEVSSKAQRIWEKWAGMPDVYDMEQMDAPAPDPNQWIEGEDFDPEIDYFLTRDKSDDISMDSFLNNSNLSSYSSNLGDNAYDAYGNEKGWWYFWSEDFRSDFLDSGLTKRFKMKDSEGFISALKEYGILKYQFGEEHETSA